MEEKLGQGALNQVEDVWVSLQEIRGEPHVELRVCPRAMPGDVNPRSSGQVIVLPVKLLPGVLRVMAAAEDLLIERGLIPHPKSETMGPGEPITVRRAAPPDRGDSRRHPRMGLHLPVECRLIDSAGIWPGKRMMGELKDVSIGGAQLWLPERLPRFKQVEVSTVIEGKLFRGRAEIVGAELQQKHSKNRHYRHSLHWMEMGIHAKVALSGIIPALVEPDLDSRRIGT